MALFSRRFFLLVLGLIALNAGLFLLWQVRKDTQEVHAVGQDSSAFPELTFFSGRVREYKEIADFFQALAEERGAAYAYNALRVAPIPAGVDLHLLGHVVGDQLYKQEGIKGMYRCTQEFRNACSHSIVVGLFLDHGEGALSEITDACKKAPGGSGAYTMCFHGLGHGVLAYYGYDLAKAIPACEKTGLVEGDQCIGGAIMEIVGGGFHDTAAWESQRKVFLKNDNPLYPCNSDLVPKSAKGFCYTYLTPHLLVAAGGTIHKSDPNTFQKAFTFCGQLSPSDPAFRSCYGGFGKDFVVLAKGQDIRHIDDMNDQELGTVYDWCSLADNNDGKRHCLLTALSSLFWGGENDPKAAVRFCEIAKEEQFQSACFRELIIQTSRYLAYSEKADVVCALVPSQYRQECLARTR